MKIQESKYRLNPISVWDKKLSGVYTNMFPGIECMNFFDQSGYALCDLELKYAEANNNYINANREKQGIYMPWLECNNIDGAHINHSWLLERKGYAGEALEQLNNWSKKYPMLFKLSKLKPKWGIDISFDYVDTDGNVMELFHYEWDSHILEDVLKTKDHIQKLVLEMDWEDFAKRKLDKKDEWKHLDFIAQSKWTTDYLNLPPENFKLVPWML